MRPSASLESRVLCAVLVMLFASLSPSASAQVAARSGTGPSLAQMAFPEVYARLDPASPPALRKSYPWVSVGLRGGVFAVTDEDSEEVYGAMLMYGADLKVHIWKLPLAVQLGYDLARGEGSTDDYGGTKGVDATGRVIFWNLRISLILEPPPGLFGPSSGGFYVTPYVGGGIGYHVIEVDLEGDTNLGPFDETVTDERIGYHALLGIDFVFAKLFSVGMEFMWTTVQIEDPLDADETLEFGGLSASLSLRFHI